SSSSVSPWSSALGTSPRMGTRDSFFKAPPMRSRRSRDPGPAGWASGALWAGGAGAISDGDTVTAGFGRIVILRAGPAGSSTPDGDEVAAETARSGAAPDAVAPPFTRA